MHAIKIALRSGHNDNMSEFGSVGIDPLIITAAAKCKNASLDRFCTRLSTTHVVTLHTS